MDRQLAWTAIVTAWLGSVLVAAVVVQAQSGELPRGLGCNCLIDDETFRPYCGVNEYLVGPDDPPGNSRSGDRASGVTVRGCCCPMPADDILSDVHIYAVDEACPPDSIVTGGSVSHCSRNCLMRCTKINTSRYKLGPVRKGVYWRRRGWVLMGGWGGAQSIYWDEIPAAIRLAHGRVSREVWDGDGCASDPLGAPLVAKRGKLCDLFEFREILTLQGAPIVMFPDCATELDKYATNPTCVLK